MIDLLRRSGFSLVELVFSLGLLAVVGGIAVPSASRMLQSYHLSELADVVSFEISRARMQAIAQNRFVRISFESDRFCRQSAGDVAGPWDPASCESGEFIRYPAGTSASPSGTIHFDGNGIANEAVDITVSNPSGSKTVSMNILGRTET